MSADFDKAIDRAVREMLDVEPPADLRAKVMTQLPVSGSRRPAAGFRLPAGGWVLATVAAAAMLLVAVFVARRGEPVAPQTPTLARANDTRLPASQPAAVEAIAPRRGTEAPRESGPAAVAPARAARMVAAASVAGNDGAVAIDPLQAIAPITIAPIAQTAIAPAEIGIRPLNPISELQVAPLTPPDRRN